LTISPLWAKYHAVNTFAKIQEAIARLGEVEREELRLWLETYEEDDWDRQITADATSGKLDFLKKQAQAAKKRGQLRPLRGEVARHTAKSNWKAFFEAHPPVQMHGPANLSPHESFGG
jgi:hypothetical protein